MQGPGGRRIIPEWLPARRQPRRWPPDPPLPAIRGAEDPQPTAHDRAVSLRRPSARAPGRRTDRRTPGCSSGRGCGQQGPAPEEAPRPRPSLLCGERHTRSRSSGGRPVPAAPACSSERRRHRSQPRCPAGLRPIARLVRHGVADDRAADPRLARQAAYAGRLHEEPCCSGPSSRPHLRCRRADGVQTGEASSASSERWPFSTVALLQRVEGRPRPRSRPALFNQGAEQVRQP